MKPAAGVNTIGPSSWIAAVPPAKFATVPSTIASPSGSVSASAPGVVPPTTSILTGTPTRGVALSAFAIGARSAVASGGGLGGGGAVTVPLTAAVAVPPRPSLIVDEKVSLPDVKLAD